MLSQDNYIVSLDIGSSSARALLFDGAGRPCAGFGDQLTYKMTTTPDGGVETDAHALADLTIRCLSVIHQQIQNAGIRPAAVATSAFWHSFLGLDATGKPTTPILHLFDTRATADAEALARELDAAQVHQRTGCCLHASYWPAKLRWLERTRREAFRATQRWLSFPEFLLLRICGAPASSVSMASGSGLWNLEGNQYDVELLRALPISEDQLWPAARMDEPLTRLEKSYSSIWPLLNGIPWYPAFGDGACSNIGSGCVTPDEFCLMVGTSGAIRAVTGASRIEIPSGLWCYRVDRDRHILGGALTNGGDVYAWMRRNFQLANDSESQIANRMTGEHGLTLLPFFGGERSPYWRGDLRGAITGLGLTTEPLDILQAALEAVALSFGEIFVLMRLCLGTPQRVIASGGALQRSRVWAQMMADALNVSVILGTEKEASARGAALLALERLGVLGNLLAVEGSETFEPRPEHVGAFARLAIARDQLYQRLFKES